MEVGWTVFSTREHPPEQLASFEDAEPAHALAHGRRPRASDAAVWLLAGAGIVAAVLFAGLAKELYILAGMLLAYGAAVLMLSRSRANGMFSEIMADLHDMPEAMRRLAVVQFFSWFALFSM